jgi:adenosine deaminase/DNA-binding NarL/FixJ family response regulator
MTTYRAYPVDSVHTRAVGRRLLATNIDGGTKVADYLIFQQGDDDGYVDSSNLRFFLSIPRCRARSVVMIPSYRFVAGLQRASVHPSWLSVAGLDGAPVVDHGAASLDDGELLADKRLSNTAVKALFASALGARSNKSLATVLNGLAGTYFRGIGAEAVKVLLGSRRIDDLYYLLCRITQGYSEQLHDVLRVNSEVGEHYNKEGLQIIGERAVARLVLSVAQALAESVRAGRLIARGDTFRVLVVDDDERAGGLGYAEMLRQIADVFFPTKYEIWFWNPFSRSQRDAERVLTYRSMDRRVANDSMVISVRGVVPADVQNELSIDELTATFDFILIDQLYRPFRESYGAMLGPAFIRGFSRLLYDASVLCSSDGLPQIVAISRNDDPESIQAALRSGAQDYVLKSQMLRLPAVMARVQSSIGRRSDAYHQNFPELYRLPNETQGLLRAVAIPATQSLHRPVAIGGDSEESTYVQREVARLLSAIPKTDLHVHAGSCMSVEFLVLASAIGLARSMPTRPSQSDDARNKWAVGVSSIARVFGRLTSLDGERWTWEPVSPLKVESASDSNSLEEQTDEKRSASDWISALGNQVRRLLVTRMAELSPAKNSVQYETFRAILHKELNIRDRLLQDEAERELAALPVLELALFGLRYAKDLDDGGPGWARSDLIRILLLTLAARHEPYRAELKLDGNGLLDLFRPHGHVSSLGAWRDLADLFYCGGQFSVEKFRRTGWSPVPSQSRLQLTMQRREECADYAAAVVSFERDPIEYTIATGLRAQNLVEYLQGCEFSGAEHLRHPFLIHIYSQQLVTDMVKKGVFYAEVRASPSGYVEGEFRFRDVCQCLEAAFSEAQRAVVRALASPEPADWESDLLGSKYSLRQLVAAASNGGRRGAKRMPCKVSLIYVGKRHKPAYEMMLEAAAAAVMRPSEVSMVRTASQFADSEVARCRVVGFDLAGKEVGNPPERFVEEFSRLSRLHIPLTVHAGENESAQFIEDSVLRLRARRIGHGLTLVEDESLVARVREDRIGIELCPISNFQTSHFGSMEAPSVRPYPLRTLIDRGVLVSINTDNPIISHTNIVREFFQASFAWAAAGVGLERGQAGMPLWEALRIVRMGYVMSFMNLSERRAALEMAGQAIYDLFVDDETVNVLRELARSERASMI